MTAGLILAFILLLPAPVDAAELTQSCDWPSDYQDFYTPPADLGNTAPDQMGRILRVEHMNTLTSDEIALLTDVAESAYGAEVYRILYLSVSRPGEPSAVSGLIVVPTGQMPTGGWPVMAHAFGTTGLADQCAPSRRQVVSGTNILPWVARGYMVVSTDYAGLGTPGFHPYGIGDVSGRNVIDSAIAARSFCDNERGIPQSASSKVIVEGHSQGGLAALFAHQLWDEFGDGLDLEGTVVFAPGAELRFMAQRLTSPIPSPLVDAVSLAMVAYSRYYGAPSDLSTWLQEPYASQLPDRVETQCASTLATWLGFRPENVFQSSLLSAIKLQRWSDLEPWLSYIDLNTPGNFSSEEPVLILQAQDDLIVPVGTAQRLSERLCSLNNSVEYRPILGSGHFGVVRDGRQIAADWMAARIAGVPVSNRCGSAVKAIDFEPVVVKGAQLPNFQGIGLNRIFAYRFQPPTGWIQIPLQVDRMAADGTYLASTAGVLGPRDEIVFMAGDAGAVAGAASLPIHSLPIGDAWYRVQVDQDGTTRYVYLVTSQVLAPALKDHVTYDQSAKSVKGLGYALEMSEETGLPSTFRLGKSEKNILAGINIVLECGIPALCPITEESVATPLGFVKDGPVRAILKDGNLIAYSNKIEWTTSFTIPASLTGNLRFTTGISESVKGASLFTGAITESLTIDGVADGDLSLAPLSEWWQLSTESGALIQVIDPSQAGGPLTNFYRDGAPGEGLGEIGYALSNPSSVFRMTMDLYALEGIYPRIGDRFFVAARTTPQVSVVSQSRADQRIYLPSVHRE